LKGYNEWKRVFKEGKAEWFENSIIDVLKCIV
jgi:hypothetical protein